jgi:hypothetical protein
MRKLFTLILLIIPFGLFAQVSTGSLSVHIVDENEEGFYNSEIVLKQNERIIGQRTTSAYGNCFFIGLESGQYILYASHIGYCDSEIEFTVLGNNTMHVNGKLYAGCGCRSLRRIINPMIIDNYGTSTTYKTDQILKMPVR